MMSGRPAALLLGLLVGWFASEFIDMASPYRPPAGLKLRDEDGVTEAFVEYIANRPTPAFLFTIVGHGLSALAAAATATWIHGRRFRIGAVGLGIAFLILFGATPLLVVRHPVWFAVLDLAIFVPAALLGGRLGETLLQKKRAMAEKLGLAGGDDPPTDAAASAQKD